MGWVVWFLQFSPALPSCPPSQDSVPSLAVCGLMRSRPSHPGGGGIWIPRQRVCVKRRERETKGREVRSSCLSRRWGAPGGEKGS